MRIAFDGLIIDKERAGIGQYGYYLMKHLGMHDEIHCTFFIRRGMDAKGLNVHYCRDYRKSYQRIFDQQFVLPRIFNAFDLVHYIDYSSPALGLKVPYIITIHDLSFFKFPDTFSTGSRIVKSLLAPVGIKRAARIIADSEHTKKDILEYYPQAEDKIRVVYPGRPGFDKLEDSKNDKEILRKYGIEGSYILAIGTLEPRKNIIRLINAFGIIRKEFPGIKLVLAGKKGWLFGNIFKRIEDLELKRDIVYTGYVNQEDMPCLYRCAEVFVYPSLYEGFGFPPLEAMECGTAVVVSNVSSLPEVVGEAGMYIDPYQEESIAQGVVKLLNNEGLRQKLVSKGLNRVKKFNWAKTAQDLIEVYKEILG